MTVRSLGTVIAGGIATFLLLNAAAWLYLRSTPPDASESGLFVHRNSELGMRIRSRIFETADVDLLLAYAASPGIRPHPVLHFAEGDSQPYVTVGLEGIRYLPGWDDRRVQALLSEPGNVYVFGGSTVFGHGVPDGLTVVAQLAELDPAHTWLNFAAQAYDAIREVDKLLYLLRKGYRPGRVVFIDGLNDVTTFARSPYAVHDSPRAQGLVLDRGEVPLIFGYPTRSNMFLAFAYSFPITHVAIRWLTPPPEPGPPRRGPARLSGREDWSRLLRYHYDWAGLQEGHVDSLAADVIAYYEDREIFVRTLGEAFGFAAVFVYQPIGLLEDGQPFLTEAFHESDQYAVYRGVDARLRAAITSGRLRMTDCSRSIAESGASDGYVDATHYSPRGARVLARCVLGAGAASGAEGGPG